MKNKNYLAFLSDIASGNCTRKIANPQKFEGPWARFLIYQGWKYRSPKYRRFPSQVSGKIEGPKYRNGRFDNSRSDTNWHVWGHMTLYPRGGCLAPLSTKGCRIGTLTHTTRHEMTLNDTHLPEIFSDRTDLRWILQSWTFYQSGSSKSGQEHPVVQDHRSQPV